MSDKIKKILRYSLFCVSIMTFINIAILYWIPILNFPLSFLGIIRIMAICLVYKKYSLIFLVYIISILLILSAYLMNRDKLLFLIIPLVYIIYDLILVLWIIFGNIQSDIFVLTNLFRLMVDLYFALLYFLYFVRKKNI